ncbi:MAG: FAD-binding protein, partial [Chloroflexota bacterium]
YLGVVKRHRTDKFLLSHGVDGFSLALDFQVTRNNRGRLHSLLKDFNKLVLEGGGKFYFAKDSTLTAEDVSRYLGKKPRDQFIALKATHDPNNILQTDLFRRCFING